MRTRSLPLLVTGVLLLGVNLRMAITSLPPVFPELRSALGVSASSLSVLAAIPALCFGVFSAAGAPLSRRFGEERVLGCAVALLAAGLLLRSASPAALLFPGTVLAGAAIALLNVLLPSLVKRRIPERAGAVIGSYLLMLSAGAVVASLVAVPVFDAAGRGSAAVRLSLGLWSVTAIAAVVVWLPQWRYRTDLADASGAGRAGNGAGRGADRAGRGLLAMGRQALAWQLTLFMGLQSLCYYACLSWFATMFRDHGVSAAHAGDLLALMNAGNGVTALLVPLLAHRLADQRWLAAAAATATAAGLAGTVFGSTVSGSTVSGSTVPGPSALAVSAGWVLLLGLGQGATLGLAIFFTMARSPDPGTAAALSAFSQGAGYLIASAGPPLIGMLHQATGGWAAPGVALLAVAAGEAITGWLSGRARTVLAELPQPAAAAVG